CLRAVSTTPPPQPPSPKWRGEKDNFCSPSPLRGGGGGEGLLTDCLPPEAVLNVQRVQVAPGARLLDEVAGIEVRVLDENVLVVVQVEVHDQVQYLADVGAGAAGRGATDRR